MERGIGEHPSPDSTDLDGWREAVAGNRLRSFKLEAIAAAFQDLGQRDEGVQRALAKYLSESILRILRRRIGSNHPNRGEDIILRVHGQIFVALLRPTSADGWSLRQAFIPRLLFRMKDAIAAEGRERRIPVEENSMGGEDPEGSDEVQIVGGGPEGAVEEPEPTEDEEIIPKKLQHTTLLDGVRETDEWIDVDRILERIPDSRKRLAFYLFMNDIPYGSKKNGVDSIAQAVGISEKTARDWVKEVRQFLENDGDVKYLKHGK